MLTKNYPRKIVIDIDMKRFNVEGFCEDVSSKLVSLLKKSDDGLNVNITNLLNKITETANKYAPFRTLYRKQMKLKAKPWLTKGLLKSITTKNQLFQQYYKQQSIDLIKKYKSCQNKLTKLKEIAKMTC